MNKTVRPDVVLMEGHSSNQRGGKRPWAPHSRKSRVAQDIRNMKHRSARRKTRALSRSVARSWE